MRFKFSWLFPFLSGLTLLTTGLLLLPASVEAQCGSQASSCKTCHEVEQEFSVNSDGTGWHESHAFGDFCIMCHAGNEQATDKDAAHVGMVPPLADTEAACQMCHADDLAARVAVYTAILGDASGAGNDTVVPTSVPAATSSSADTPATPQPVIVNPPANDQTLTSLLVDNALMVNDPNAVDYVQRYNEIVLGERPVNVGNIALVILTGLVVVLGGGFVLLNEMRRIQATARVEGEYPADVIEMLPALAGLQASTRRLLKRILSNPKKSDRVLGAVSTLVADEHPEE